MLTWALESSPPAVVLRLGGLLDLDGAVRVRAALHKALAAQPSAIIVDLAAVRVHDEAMLTVFAAFARAAAAWPGCAVLLCGLGQSLHAAVGRTVVGRLLPVYADRATALIAAGLLPAPYRFDERLRPGPAAVVDARHMVADACRVWELPLVVHDAELVVTELVSNAVRHGVGDVYLSVSRRRHFLHVAVHDANPALPRRREPDRDRESGRGLVILDAVTAGWGSTPADPGKIVWATIRLRDLPRS